MACCSSRYSFCQGDSSSQTQAAEATITFKSSPSNLHRVGADRPGAGIVSLAALLVGKRSMMVRSFHLAQPIIHCIIIHLGFIRILFNTTSIQTLATDIVVRGSVGDFSNFKYHLRSLF